MTGKKPRPSTEPMYSGGNLRDFPITSGYDSVEYIDFIISHIRNSQTILITQSVHDGYFSGCFATSKMYSPRRVLSVGIERNYDTFLELVEKEWQWINGNSKQIYSLACDEKFGFGVFFMDNFGTSQTILRDTSDIQQKWDDDFRITACAARGSTFYVIMTKDTKEYKRKAQRWIICNTWTEVHDEIQEGYKEGQGITGICYSSGLGQYFVVMTEMPGRQSCHWSDSTNEGNIARSNWMEENYEEGLHPTIIFKDPTDNKILVVVTQDENISGYECMFNYKMK